MREKYTELKFMTVTMSNLIKTLQSKTNTFTQNPIRIIIISPNLNSITQKHLNLKSLKQNNTQVPFKQKHIKTKNNNQIPKKQLTTLNIKTQTINNTLNTIKNSKK